jgi:transposase
MKASTHTEYAAFVGIDWADRKHDVCLQPAGCDTREFSVLPHRPEHIAQWVQALRQRFSGRPIAVCLEVSKVPLVCALQPYDFLVLFPVNPTTLAKYREAFCLSHAKDDPTDAEPALELLMTHRDKLTELQPQSAAMRALQRLVEQRRALVADKVRLPNRLTDALK